MSIENKPAFEGRWTDQVRWKFYPSTDLPPSNLCTAVFCLPFQRDKILLVRHPNRNWEMPGGHIDDGEDVYQALQREVLEEGRIKIVNPRIIGYRKVITTTPQDRRDGKTKYPHPFSYIPFFMTRFDEIEDSVPESEILERKLFSREEASVVLQRDSNYKIVDYTYTLLHP